MISRMRVISQLCKMLGKRDKCGCVLSSEISVTYGETGINECYLGRGQDEPGSVWKSSHFRPERAEQISDREHGV